MASNLTNTSLIINGTQQITGVSTTLNKNDTELPTSAAFIAFLEEQISSTPVLIQFTVDLSTATALTFIN